MTHLDKNIIPNLFLIGAPKSGTTALAKNISKHEDIFLPKKERSRYFDGITFYDNQNDNPDCLLEEYISSFDSQIARNSMYRLDTGALSMYKKESIKNILDLSPDAKFIVLLREPVSASLSMHRQRLGYADAKMREVSDDFMECWSKLEEREKGVGFPKGCRNRFLFRYDLLYSYEKYIPFLRDIIKKENYFIGFYDDFVKTPTEFYDELFDFLGIKNKKIENKKINKPSIIKKSILFELVDMIARNSYFIREKFGLVDTNFMNKIRYIYITDNMPRQKVDESVYKFFGETNNYLERLKQEIKAK